MLTMNLQQIASMLQNKDQYSLLSDINKDIEVLRKFFFDFDFVFYNESKKEEFLNNWLLHFYMREHAFETVAMFKYKIRDFFLTNIPQFNKAFSFYSGDFTIDESINYTESYEFSRNFTGKEKFTGNGNSNLNVTNNAHNYTDQKEGGITRTQNNAEEKNAFSDTPEGKLSNVEQLSYLSEYRNISNNTENQINHGKTDHINENKQENSKQTGIFLENNQKENNDSEKQNYTKKVLGNMGARSVIYDYKEFMEKMKSVEHFFYELSDKYLFLHTWDL